MQQGKIVLVGGLMNKLLKEEHVVSRFGGSQLCYRLWKVLEYFWITSVPIFLTATFGILLVDARLIPKLLVGILWNMWIIPHLFIAASIPLGLIVLTGLLWRGSKKYALHLSSPAVPTSEKLEEPVENAA